MPVYQLQGKAPTFEEKTTNLIAPTAVLIGNVEIAREVSIWFGAVLRGDNEPIRIRAGSNVQENVVMHTDPGYPLLIEEGCTIGHKVMLHGCTIKQSSLIGMGATLLNGAVIGEESLVGAHTLIPEGKTYPPRSLIIGTPGKVVRTLSDEDVARLQKSAATYRAKIPLYQSGLVEV